MVVSTSAIDCLERLVSEVSSGMLNPTRSLTPVFDMLSNKHHFDACMWYKLYSDVAQALCFCTAIHALLVVVMCHSFALCLSNGLDWRFFRILSLVQFSLCLLFECFVARWFLANYFSLFWGLKSKLTHETQIQLYCLCVVYEVNRYVPYNDKVSARIVRSLILLNVVYYRCVFFCCGLRDIARGARR